MAGMLRNSAINGAIVVSLYLGATAAANAVALPGVQNGSFTAYTGSAPKDYFTSVNPTGWSGGGGLTFVDKAGTADNGSYLSVYGPFPNPPVAGNFVEADGNPSYAGAFYQTITGLTVGQTYTLGFYQAGGQQAGFGNGTATTEQWLVSLGTSVVSSKAGGPVDPVYGKTNTYYNNDANASIVLSPIMTTPSAGVTPWQYVTVSLVADATTDILSFLAWGDKGSTVNLPPIVFLAGVGSTPVPEPATASLLGVGLIGLGVAFRRRRAKAAEAA